MPIFSSVTFSWVFYDPLALFPQLFSEFVSLNTSPVAQNLDGQITRLLLGVWSQFPSKKVLILTSWLLTEGIASRQYALKRLFPRNMRQFSVLSKKSQTDPSEYAEFHLTCESYWNSSFPNRKTIFSILTHIFISTLHKNGICNDFPSSLPFFLSFPSSSNVSWMSSEFFCFRLHLLPLTWVPAILATFTFSNSYLGKT